jgi:hypothetical protein
MPFHAASCWQRAWPEASSRQLRPTGKLQEVRAALAAGTHSLLQEEPVEYIDARINEDDEIPF